MIAAEKRSSRTLLGGGRADLQVNRLRSGKGSSRLDRRGDSEEKDALVLNQKEKGSLLHFPGGPKEEWRFLFCRRESSQENDT